MKLYSLAIGNENFDVVIEKMDNQTITANVNGKEIVVGIKEIKNLLPTEEERVKVVSKPQAIASKKIANPASMVLAPIPGQILEISVKVGDVLVAGQKVLMMEAMKLENEINTHKAGVVKAILVQVGESVSQDQQLIELGE